MIVPLIVNDCARQMILTIPIKKCQFINAIRNKQPKFTSLIIYILQDEDPLLSFPNPPFECYTKK